MDPFFKSTMELTIGRHWDYVIHILSFLHAFLAAYVTDEADVHRLAAVTTELVENAVKYASEGGASLRVTVSRSCVMVEIENKADLPHINLLREEYAKIKIGTPAEAYLRKIMAAESSAHRGLLGLARIRLESKDALEFTITPTLISARVEYLLPDEGKHVQG